MLVLCLWPNVICFHDGHHLQSHFATLLNRQTDTHTQFSVGEKENSRSLSGRSSNGLSLKQVGEMGGGPAALCSVGDYSHGRHFQTEPLPILSIKIAHYSFILRR